jgi:hypothetical protein
VGLSRQKTFHFLTGSPAQRFEPSQFESKWPAEQTNDKTQAKANVNKKDCKDQPRQKSPASHDGGLK